MQRLSKVLDVVRRDTRNADPSILGEVNVVLIDELGHLFRRDAEEGEHADLVGCQAKRRV